MVKIARFHKYGDPDVLQFDELSLDDPGEGEVLVRVSAMSLNRADLLWMQNNYVETPELPAKLGYEIAGTVEAVGSKVTEFQIGDRVNSIPAFSISDYANFGEATILPARGLMKIPDNFSFTEGSSFAFSYFTGYFALLELGNLQAYQTVLITAGTSTTGLAAISIAKKIGAKIIATTRTSKKRQILLDAGADYVVATNEEDLTSRVIEITDGHGADVIYDAVAGSLSEQLANAVATRGHWIVYGILDLENIGAFPWWTAFIRSFHFHTYKVFDFTGNPNLDLPGDEEAFERAKQFIAAGLADGSFHITIDREFQGLESLVDALKYMASNQASGKITIVV